MAGTANVEEGEGYFIEMAELLRGWGIDESGKENHLREVAEDTFGVPVF